VRAAGGRLTIRQADGRFALTAELPRETRQLVGPELEDLWQPALSG
jgi:hypothetical protein